MLPVLLCFWWAFSPTLTVWPLPSGEAVTGSGAAWGKTPAVPKTRMTANGRGSYKGGWMEAWNFFRRASTRSRPNTRNMLVILGPALVPETARRATAW